MSVSVCLSIYNMLRCIMFHSSEHIRRKLPNGLFNACMYVSSFLPSCSACAVFFGCVSSMYTHNVFSIEVLFFYYLDFDAVNFSHIFAICILYSRVHFCAYVVQIG